MKPIYGYTVKHVDEDFYRLYFTHNMSVVETILEVQRMNLDGNGNVNILRITDMDEMRKLK